MRLSDDLRREMMAGDVAPRVAPLMNRAATILDRIEALSVERGADMVEADPIWPDELLAIVRRDNG